MRGLFFGVGRVISDRFPPLIEAFEGANGGTHRVDLMFTRGLPFKICSHTTGGPGPSRSPPKIGSQSALSENIAPLGVLKLALGLRLVWEEILKGSPIWHETEHGMRYGSWRE